MPRWMLCGLVLGGCSFPHGSLDPIVDTPTDSRKDTDDDGVVDELDNCPAVANTDQLDHDGDKHGDPCDHCPHLSSAADPDGDGDGIGDDCDPRPQAAGDKVALWEGFYAVNAINGWTRSGSWSVLNGSVHQPATTGETYLQPPITFQHPYVAVGATVDGLGGPTAQFGLCTSLATGQYYCCIAKSQGPTLSATSYGVVTGYDDVTLSASMSTGSQLTLVESEVGQHGCIATQSGTTTTAQTALGATAGIIELYTQAAAASYDYLFIVEIGP